MKNMKDTKVIHEDLKLLMALIIRTIQRDGILPLELLYDTVEDYDLVSYIGEYPPPENSEAAFQKVLEAIDRIQYKIEEFEALVNFNSKDVYEKTKQRYC